MPDIILDSSVYISSVFLEAFTPQAQKLLKQLSTDQIMLHAPILLRYEIIAVSRKAVYQNRATPEEALKARDKMLGYPIKLHFDDELLKRAYELATKYNRPTAYDAQYLALAERLSCDFWTVDERMYNAIHADFKTIQWLGSITV